MATKPPVKILHVDDYEPIRYAIGEVLRDAGFEVLQAGTGMEALALAATGPDLIILDVNLPDIDGFEVCRRLKANPDTASSMVLHLSGVRRGSEDRAAGLDGGADGYLTHPVEPAELLATVRALLRIRQAERAVQASGRQWQATFDAIHDGVALLDLDGRVVRGNRAVADLLGRPPGQIRGHSWRELLSEAGASSDVSAASVDASPREGMELRIGDRWFRLATDPVHDEGGAPTGHVWIMTDITTRRQAEDRLRDSQVRLAGIIDSAMDAIVSVDAEQRITAFNHGAEQIFRCSASKALGQPIDRLIPERFRAAHREHIRAFGRTGITTRSMTSPRELVGLRADGEEFPIEATISQFEAGGQKFFTVILRDVTERKRAEVTVHQLAAIVESSDDAIVGFTLDGVVESWNAGAERTYGYAAAEIVGRSLSAIIPPDRPDELPSNLARLRRGERIEHYETIRLRKDGTCIPVALTISPIKDEAGRTVGASGIGRDITERKRAEAERVERRFRDLVEGLDAIVWEADAATWQFAFVSRRAERILGYPVGRWLAEPDFWVNLVHPEDRERAVSSRLTATREGRDSDFEYRVVAAGGRVVWLRDIVYVARDAEGQVGQLRGVMVDVTAQKQVAEALRQSEARLAEAQRIAQLGSWELDLSDLEDVNRSALRWSDEVYRLFGYAPGEVEVTNALFFAHVPPEDHAVIAAAVGEALRTGRSYDLEHRLVRRGGAQRVVHERAEVTCDAAGRPRRLVGTVQDVTERKRTEAALRQSEEQLRQAQKMEAVGRLAGGVAHDFNNLLTVITGYSELLLARRGQHGPLRKDVEEIRKAADRAAALTRQLLAFSRQQVLQPRVLDLNAVVADMEKMLRRLIGEDIDLVASAGSGLGRVEADPGQLEQVLLNLAVNARDAMPEGGRLSIETADVELDEAYAREHPLVRPGPYVLLAVSDTGCGMDGETQARIFEPFFTTKEQGKGTGLGLSTVYGIVKQSGGYIWVYSEPGRGTTFKIYLPRIEGPVETQAPAVAPAEPAGGTETILLVEDDTGVRTLARRALEEAGYRVLEARDGGEALTVSEGHEGPIALVLTDLVMPGANGREVAQRLAAMRPDVKVLFMSGYTDNAVLQQRVFEPGTAFLDKPFTPAALARKVREVLDTPRAG